MNLDFYRPIKLNNIDIIKTKMLEIVQKHVSFNEPLFRYIESDEFINIPEFKKQLQAYELYDYISYCVISISTQGTSAIHIDTGGFTYSLNIPILGFDNTFLNFYSSAKAPEIKLTPKGVEYLGYDVEDCELAYKVESKEPVLINTQIPHSFQNCNTDPRLVILCRINRDWDIRKWSYLKLASREGVEPPPSVLETDVLP